MEGAIGRGYMDLIWGMCIGMLLVFMTVMVHYEILRLLWGWMPRFDIPTRLRVLVVIFGVFLAHTIEIWIFSLAYFALGGSDGGLKKFELDGFHIVSDSGFLDYLYFSAVTYTSLGFGDLVPLKQLKLLAGIEALVGLLMIAWSASFTYLNMEKYWDIPTGEKKR